MIQIQPKTVWPSPNFKNKNYNFSTRFKFCNVEQSYFNVITLSVEWETPIPVSSSEYYQQLHDFYFTNDEKNLYGSKIVKDIKVYR
ncbi:hypothetical protein [Chryseobacterium hagamense]|nr:hypothetical protein [Chryseobacterium hagamense]